MCFPKNKKGRPLVPPKKAASLRATPTATKVSVSRKKISSAPARGPDLPVPPSTQPTSQAESSAKETTCISDKSDKMQISAYKNPKKKDGGSGSGPNAKAPVDKDQDSPEVFENNAQVVSLNPVNVTQIFVDSVVPQTNMSKVQSDVIDQNTLENVEINMEDKIFDPLDNGEQLNPEVPQPRPRAKILEPEDETVLDNTFSERKTRASEKRTRVSTARTDRRHISTPDRLPSAFTPPPPTKSEKVYHTCKRAARGPVSTRTTTVSRQRPSNVFQSVPHPAEHFDSGALENTAPSQKQTKRERTRRPSATEYRTVVQTAIPMEPKDATCGSREAVDSTATARKTTTVVKPPPTCMSNVYTANMKDP